MLLAAEEAFLLCLLPCNLGSTDILLPVCMDTSCLEACGQRVLPSISRFCSVSAKTGNRSNTVGTKQEPLPLEGNKPHTSSKPKGLVAESKSPFPNFLCFQFCSELALSLCREDTQRHLRHLTVQSGFFAEMLPLLSIAHFLGLLQ